MDDTLIAAHFMTTKEAELGAIVLNHHGLNDGLGARGTPPPALYINRGDLEVVPKRGTWALMLGELGLLIVVRAAAVVTTEKWGD